MRLRVVSWTKDAMYLVAEPDVVEDVPEVCFFCCHYDLGYCRYLEAWTEDSFSCFMWNEPCFSKPVYEDERG